MNKNEIAYVPFSLLDILENIQIIWKNWRGILRYVLDNNTPFKCIVNAKHLFLNLYFKKYWTASHVVTPQTWNLKAFTYE